MDRIRPIPCGYYVAFSGLKYVRLPQKKEAGLESLSSACRTDWMQREAFVFCGGYQVRSLRALPDVARGRRRRG